MKKYLNILKNCKLFYNMSDEDIIRSLTCLRAVIKEYEKNEIIYLAGDKVSKIGIVLDGNALVTKDDIMGNRNILTSINESEMFAETFVLSNIDTIPSTVTSTTDSKVLFLEITNLVNMCEHHCSYHNTLIRNLLNILANKNVILNNKIEILSGKTTRDKLLAYFNIQVIKNKSSEFKIPYNRESLADYLNLNRSSMSRELSAMQDEGIIKYNKNTFEILI